MQLILRVVRGDLQAPVLRFLPGRYVLGRDDGCHVCLRQGGVSRQHCSLNVGTNEAFVCDLDSRNHTYVNNRRIEAEGPLRDGDQLKVCDTLFGIQMLPDSAEACPEWITVSLDGPGVAINSPSEPRGAERNRETVRERDDARPHVIVRNESGEALQRIVSGVYEIPLNIPGCHLALTVDLLRPLGRGAFGEVWWVKTRGTCPDWHEGALKISHEAGTGARAWRARRAAAFVTAKPRHPHLVSLRFIGSFLGRLAVETEVADGSLADLADALPRTDCKPRLIAAMRESAAALDHLHDHGLVHGCPKPTDILLFRGLSKLGDLDLVHDPREESDAASVTRFGAPDYLAPEVWDGRTSPRSDQYALACGYAELRGGRRVFPALNRAEWERCHRTVDPDVSRLTPLEQAAVRRALAKDPEARFRSCAAFAAAVSAAG
jgi:hypothetical protein